MNVPKHQITGLSRRAGWAQSRVLVLLAVGYQWFYNGANFVAFKVGGDAVHPLLLATMRFAIAALIILPFGLWRLYRRRADLSELANAAGLGVTMLVGASRSPSSGPTCCRRAWRRCSDRRRRSSLHYLPGSRCASRLACGKSVASRLASRVLCSWLGSLRASGGFSPVGAALTLAASGCWAGGSLWAPRLRLPADPVVALTTQLVAAATVLVIAAVAKRHGRPDRPDPPASFNLVGSRLSHHRQHACWLWGLPGGEYRRVATDRQHLQLCLPSGRAAAVSRPAAGEQLTLPKLFAAGVALSGVALMVRGGSPTRREVILAGESEHVKDISSRPSVSARDFPRIVSRIISGFWQVIAESIQFRAMRSP